MILISLGWFVFWCFIMILSGTFLVKALDKLANFLKITQFAAAFIIMAVATSLPELFVGINSAIKNETAVILGTIIGSNIANLTIIIAVPILLARGIKVSSKAVRKDSMFTIFIVLLPLILFFIGRQISRIDALILIAVFFIYSYKVMKRRQKYTKKLEETVKRWDVVLTTLLFAGFLVLLFISAGFVVKYAINLSDDLKFPPIIMGLFLVAFGTSLPELVFGIKAVRGGFPDMALGDIFGSVICNSTLILGITALITPITAAFAPFLVSALFLIVITVLFSSFSYSGRKIDIFESIVLLFLYLLFIIVEVYIKGANI